MNWMMVKGRGQHQGKYLRDWYSRRARASKRAWVGKQTRASRFDRHEARRRAQEVGGYVVKLVAPKAIVARVEELQDFIIDHTAGAPEALDCYWIHGDDVGDNYCYDCCTAKVEKLHAVRPENAAYISVDGGWRIEHDSLPYCETCGATLDGSLTDYGSDQELEALIDEAAPTFDDAAGWAALFEAVSNIDDDDPRWRDIARVVDAARAAELAKAAREAELSAAPGMSETRSSLLALLRARMEQKRAEPSYRLWTELQRYVALPFEKRDEPSKKVAKLEKRLLKEAEAFAELLGYGWRGDCLDAPYGTYWWPTVVEVEQHRLWRTPAFLEGHAYGLHPCPSGNPEWPHSRDANPYSAATAEHRAWDCGFISTMRV